MTASGLEAIVERYHHLLEEHRRAGVESSARRRLEARLDEVAAQLERALAAEVADEDERQAWRDRLHHGAAQPSGPPARPELTFRGRAESGSVVEIRCRPDGDQDVAVDGVLVDRLRGEVDFDAYVDGDRAFPEAFDAPAAAREALLAWVADPRGEPPLEHLAALVEDGLVDRDLALTRRDRRLADREGVSRARTGR